jgi:hypothetical protein
VLGSLLYLIVLFDKMIVEIAKNNMLTNIAISIANFLDRFKRGEFKYRRDKDT